MKTLYKELTIDEVNNLETELEQIRLDIKNAIGEDDANYIRNIITIAKYHEIIGRLLIHFSIDPVTWCIGVGMLSISKILDNMEIGHNVLHGQYDWMNDPQINSLSYEWDNVTNSAQWKFLHNYMHHTFTNIVGKDHDVGYDLVRITKEQKWSPENTYQIFTTVLLALYFEWGIGNYGANVEYMETPKEKQSQQLKDEQFNIFIQKAFKQILKDYIVFPLLGGFFAPKIFLGNFTANMIRNLWTHAVIFCGHFTDNVQMFPLKDISKETKGDWYLRQIRGSSNLEGSKVFYIMTGHLSHQIEHHLFPDLPANRYEEIAPKVKEICERYGQYYNTGSFAKQFASVWKRIFVHSFPN